MSFDTLFFQDINNKKRKISQAVKFTLLILFTSLGTSLSYSDVLTMKVSKSLEDSGFTKNIFPKVEEAIEQSIEFGTVSSGGSLQRRALGKVDLLFINSHKEEKKLVRQGWAVGRFPIMTSDFLFVGPKNDPANIQNAKNLSELFIRLVTKKTPFFSRGDNSGLHIREQALWHSHALLPKGAKWYQETNQNMTATLKKANKAGGYTLVDRATWLSNKKKLNLVELRSGDRALQDLYSIVLRNSDRELVNIAGSSNFLEWFNSEEGRKVVSEFKIEGESVFIPLNKE